MRTLVAKDVIDTSFVDAFGKALNIEELGAGRHICRDERGWRAGELTVHKVCLAEITPAFAAHACLAIIIADSRQLALLAIRKNPVVTVVGPVEGTWVESIARVMECFDVWSGERGTSLDGVSYSIFVDTRVVQLAVNFSNPRTPQLESLERALVHTARHLSINDTTGVAAAFIDDWASHTADSLKVPTR